MKGRDREYLKKVLTPLLKEEDHYGEIKASTDALYEFFLKMTDVEGNDEVYIENIETESGRAIGAFWAARCVCEFLRTKQFIYGIYNGIIEAKRRFPEERIRILYAGTGPFGALVFPLTAFFDPEEISITGLEINPESIRQIGKVIQHLEIEAYVEEIFYCDATQVDISRHVPYHIMVSETMLNALRREPQVSIMQNLVPHLQTDGIWIPENILVELSAVDSKKQHRQKLGDLSSTENCSISIGTVLNLNRETCMRNESFQEIRLKIQNFEHNLYELLVLNTVIQVFGNVFIQVDECSLTLPQRLTRLSEKAQCPKGIVFNYRVDVNPGFDFQLEY